MNIGELKIYANDGCGYCKELKNELDKQGIRYINVDTTDPDNKEEWTKVVDATFIPTVPTVLYKDTYFVAGRDFASPTVLLTMLDGFQGLDYSNPKLVLERIRTLTYSITMAFGRMDNLLRNIENKLNIKENEHKSTD